ncbi:signal peptidase I [Paenibacillus sambharensis]|uniref:Signal peptidase I n=1 Tax=Paenibacillus sambharensis TaxID=1803190 RepID=A0A2W1LA50_9BACL|nr:signal peptidase I [Paenibacillus sambharensis]PZD95609.1 signal peptidase I [Paenibacillus sambharensis]
MNEQVVESTEETGTRSARSRRKQQNREPEEKRGRPRWLSELLDWARTLGIAFVIVLLVHLFVFNLSTVDGHSMEPTLEDKQWLFVNKIGYLIGEPERGDVVILEDPMDSEGKAEYLVKRIIGVPGDTVEIRSGRMYLNGEQLVESYTDVDIEDVDYGPQKVGEGTYFVMGDNRHLGASKDSRTFGPVSSTLIKGKAQFVIWPITHMNKL